jgi:hypothetical protein
VAVVLKSLVMTLRGILFMLNENPLAEGLKRAMLPTQAMPQQMPQMQMPRMDMFGQMNSASGLNFMRRFPWLGQI